MIFVASRRDAPARNLLGRVHMTTTRWLLPLCLAACGSGSSTPAEAPALADTTPPAVDAPSVDAPLPATECAGRSLDFSLDEITATAHLNALLAQLREHAPDAYFRERVDGTTALAQIAAIHAPLATAPDADPRLDAISWLALAASDTFSDGEWAPDPTSAVDPTATTVGDVFVSRMVRTHVAGVPWPSTYPDRYVEGPGLTLLVDRTDAGWTLREVDFVPVSVLASEPDARLLADCAPVTPSTPLASYTFEGIEFEGCVDVGRYAYTANPDDTVTIAPGISFALSAPVGGRARFTTSRPATLTVAEANYWPRVAYSDAACGDTVGWTVTLDAVTGAVQRVQPGILCVVC